MGTVPWKTGHWRERGSHRGSLSDLGSAMVNFMCRLVCPHIWGCVSVRVFLGEVNV